MTKTLSEHVAIRKARQRAYRNRKTIGSEFGELYVTKNKRSVRITVNTRLDQLRFRQPDLPPGSGFVDLDDAAIDRLVKRLQNIRGGRRRRAP